MQAKNMATLKSVTVSVRGSFHCLKLYVVYYYCVSYTHEVFIAFHGIEWESLAATENTIPWFTGILKEFVVNIIKVIAINVNPSVTLQNRSH